MIRKYFLVSALLSLACVLMVTDCAQAQRRGVGGRRAAREWNTWVAPYTGVYADGYNRGYYGNNNNRGWYDNTYPRSSFYYTPNFYAPSDYGTPALQGNNHANIRVRVPDAQARVFFDGSPTQQLGTDRLFTTPPLLADIQNSYRIRATWMQAGREMTQERVVTVNPGATATVDFTQATAEPIPELQPQPLPPAGEMLEGRIISTGQNQFVIETRDKRQVTVFTNPQTRYTIDNRAGAFTDVRVGNNVSMGFTVQGDRHMANTVTVIGVSKK